MMPREETMADLDHTSLLPGATRELASFAAGLTFEAIPASVVEHAKLLVLDGIGVCLYGSALPWTRMVQDLALSEGAQGAASVWGTGKRTSWSLSVLANSTAGHAFEMDDIHRDSVLHPNSLTVPISLGFSETNGGITGRAALTAIVAGYEVGTRVGNAATTQLFLNGFHPQGTSGIFVAGATAGRLLGLGVDAMQHTLGIAGSLGAGLMAAQEGAMVKRLHAGHAAQNGVYAALLAQRGFTGILDVVEAPYGGFLSSLSRQPDIARLTAGLGKQWETQQVGFKMYPSVTSIHAALDALQTIMRKHSLKAEDIASIQVGVGHMTYVHTAWPYKPAGTTAAQMNMFYGLATMALGGNVSVNDFTEERLAKPELLAFMQRIAVTEDAAINDLGREARHACRMSLTTVSGAVFDEYVVDRRGSPENPVKPQELEAKFRASVRGILSEGDAEQVMRLVGELDRLDNCEPLTAILARAGSR
jgi:2-methylcitrate dehydratase PrpD